MKVFLNKIDLKAMKFTDVGEKRTSWVQIFRLGEWKHPKYGKLSFTDDIFNGFIKSFNDNVRKVDLALDTEHEPEKGACGWFKRLEYVQTPDAARDQVGLWALIEWTTRGLQLVADGVFKYISGDFDYTWKDEETQKTFKNVLFGAALTNRPFIKGMSPINLSEFMKELSEDVNLRDSFQLAEDLIKLKEGDKVKTDAEIMAMKPEDMSPEEKKKYDELMKAKQDDMMLAKKKLAERAKVVKLSEDATEADIIVAEKLLADTAAADLVKRAKAVGLPETATEAEVAAKEKEVKDGKFKFAERAKKVGLSETATEAEVVAAEKKLAEDIKPENEQKVKMAVALGLKPDATILEIEAEALKTIAAVKEIEGSARTMSDRAKSVGLAETATEAEVVAAEKELSEKVAKEKIDALLASDVPALEKRLAEMKTEGADSLTLRLLEDSIASKKKLHDEVIKNSKEKVELKLKEHFRSGKLTAKERDVLKAILFSEVETGETAYKLSEKDKDDKIVEVTKTLGEIVDAILSDRPAIVELKELAENELKEPPKDTKNLSEEEVDNIAGRVATGVAGKATKSAKKLAERAKKVGLAETATLVEVVAKEKELKEKK
ncbi:MAG: phage protease [Candidatus Bathyarchaeota archaeon]